MKLKNKISNVSKSAGVNLAKFLAITSLAVFGVAEKSQGQAISVDFISEGCGHYISNEDMKNHPEMFQNDKPRVKGINLTDHTQNLEFLRDTPNLIGINLVRSKTLNISALRSCRKLEIIVFAKELESFYKKRIEALNMGFKQVSSSQDSLIQYTRSGKSYDLLFGFFCKVEVE